MFSTSGGIGSTSNCAIDLAPWRLDVPTQSEPVSPPPMITTCLPLAESSGTAASPATRLFCSAGKSIDSGRHRASGPGIAGRALLGAGCKHDRIESVFN